MEMFSNLITDDIDCINTFSRSVVNSIQNLPCKIIIVFQLCHEIFGHYSSSVFVPKIESNVLTSCSAVSVGFKRKGNFRVWRFLHEFWRWYWDSGLEFCV